MEKQAKKLISKGQTAEHMAGRSGGFGQVGGMSRWENQGRENLHSPSKQMHSGSWKPQLLRAHTHINVITFYYPAALLECPNCFVNYASIPTKQKNKEEMQQSHLRKQKLLASSHIPSLLFQSQRTPAVPCKQTAQPWKKPVFRIWIRAPFSVCNPMPWALQALPLQLSRSRALFTSQPPCRGHLTRVTPIGGTVNWDFVLELSIGPASRLLQKLIIFRIFTLKFVLNNSNFS